MKEKHVALVTNLTGIDLTTRKFKTFLDQKVRLNDDIIFSYLGYLALHANTIAGRLPSANMIPSVVAHTFFFYKNIAEKGPRSVATWMTSLRAGGSNLLQVDLVLIPIITDTHWSLLVVPPTRRTIEYLDSIKASPDKYVYNIFLWLQAELGSLSEASEWTVSKTKVPRERNANDSGIFVSLNAECVDAGLDTASYSAEAVMVQRRRIAAVLLNKGFDQSIGLVLGDGQN